MVLHRRAVMPLNRRCLILREHQALNIHLSESELSTRNTSVCRQTGPRQRLGITLRRRTVIPLRRCSFTLRTTPRDIHAPETDLRTYMPLLRCEMHPPHRRHRIL
ncbi:uncharacterized protein METZ01_LOCUS252508 [marine metagenome]|uniref:Uncharacterized protein n=1 Tax=marine metagenome TaxID=408172 RepID=A0A382IIS3_9ZZZZ